MSCQISEHYVPVSFRVICAVYSILPLLCCFPFSLDIRQRASCTTTNKFTWLYIHPTLRWSLVVYLRQDCTRFNEYISSHQCCYTCCLVYIAPRCFRPWPSPVRFLSILCHFDDPSSSATGWMQLIHLDKIHVSLMRYVFHCPTMASEVVFRIRLSHRGGPFARLLS